MKALFGWPGGKSRLRDRIIPLIPEHTCYCEPFFGAGWVFFGKDRSKSEIVNDLDGELVNLYRVVQRHPRELLRQLRWIPVAREKWEVAKDPPRDLTDVERAAFYLLLIRQSFGNKTLNSSFAPIKTSRKNCNGGPKFTKLLQAVHDRFLGVGIENMPAVDLIVRYDRPTTFFYVDPTYYEVKD